MRVFPLACWCRQQRCLALSFGLLLVSSSSFVLSLTPPFSVLSFIFLCTDFVGVGIGTVSLDCLAFFLQEVARLIAFLFLYSIFIFFPCYLLVRIYSLVGIYGIGTVSLHCLACSFFLQVALLTAFPFLYSIFLLFPCNSLHSSSLSRNRDVVV